MLTKKTMRKLILYVTLLVTFIFYLLPDSAKHLLRRF